MLVIIKVSYLLRFRVAKLVRLKSKRNFSTTTMLLHSVKLVRFYYFASPYMTVNLYIIYMKNLQIKIIIANFVPP